MKRVLICNNCGESFLKQICPSTIISKNNFCSYDCKYEWQKDNMIKENNPFYGKKHTEKTKMLISLANSHPSKRKGIPNLKLCGDNNPAKRPEVRKKISQRVKETHWDSSLEKNPNWLGGKSYEPYTVEFNEKLKDIIRERDNHICFICGFSGEEHINAYGFDLNIHHINYDKKDSKEKNLVTLCIVCHSLVNFNRDDWKNFFEERMSEIYS